MTGGAARVVGILGGGQLARMLGLAAAPLGLGCRTLDPDPAACARACTELSAGALDDPAALAALAARCDVLTFESENVTLAPLLGLAERARFRPGLRALEVASDRLAEKRALRALGIPTADFLAVDGPGDAAAAARELGLPLLFKTRRMGYDGKGQRLVRAPDELATVWADLGARPLIAERLVPFARERSVLAARAADGELRAWPLVENQHRDGILRLSRPRPDAPTQAAAERHARALLESLDYVGVLALELFELPDGSLVANEIAPRVHNSGHWTIEGAVTSQFEQHLRAVCDLPLGATDLRGPVAMLNVVGELPPTDRVLACPGAHLHLYDKTPRPGRKLGHITITAPDDRALDEALARLRALPGVG